MTPLEIEMNDRKGKINKLLINVQNIPEIDTMETMHLFQLVNKEIDIYKYAGINILLFDFLDNEVLNDTNGFKNFLETNVPSYNISIIQMIKITLI